MSARSGTSGAVRAARETTIEDVVQFYLDASTDWYYKDLFIENMGMAYVFSDEQVAKISLRGKDPRLLSSFPAAIVTNDPNDAARMTKRRNDILIKEHDDPEIRERKSILLSTLWPTQEEPFFLEQIPLFDKYYGGANIPVDWNFIGIIRYLWDMGIPTSFWGTNPWSISHYISKNAPVFDVSKGVGYIMIKFWVLYPPKKLAKMTEDEKADIRKAEMKFTRDISKEIDGFRPLRFHKHAGIEFDIIDLPKIYRQLGQPMPKKGDAIKANLIPTPLSLPRIPLSELHLTPL